MPEPEPESESAAVEIDATPPEQSASSAALPTHSAAGIPLEVVEATIAALTAIDESGDKRTMNRMARRLGKEQPALLRRAARLKDQHGDAVGEAAVFYSTLVWAIFDRHAERAPRLTPANIQQAESVLEEDWRAVAGLAEKPIHERVAP